MIVVKEYGWYNPRRYGDPWVAKVGKDTYIDFSERVGGYTGRHHKGDPGNLYITYPVDGQVYAYGQKDYRGCNSEVNYVRYASGELTAISKQELINALEE